jgi:F-type H+-transporting ATPase subunit delta
MIDLIAKRYVKAIMSNRDDESLNSVYTELKTISSAYNSDKFMAIISSIDVKSNEKVKFILSLLDSCSDTTSNLIKLLGDKKRLNIIPEIVAGLAKELAVINNSYTGVIYTNNELSADDVEKLNTQFSKKFNVDLKLVQDVCDYNGIKVDIDGLGVEIGFSKERLKSQMIDHILKAV